jgi:hypothetical protein
MSLPKDRKPTLVYISASWKQRERVRALANALRAEGFQVYDFTDPACRNTPEIPPERFPEQFDPTKHSYREYIEAVPEWRTAVDCNRDALDRCSAVLLLLPAGADSHADWAYALGRGVPFSAVVGAPRAGERTPSHLWATARLDTDEEALRWLCTAVDMEGPCPRVPPCPHPLGDHGHDNPGGTTLRLVCCNDCPCGWEGHEGGGAHP